MLYGLAIFVLLLLVYARWLEPGRLQVSQVDIPIAGLPAALEGFTILQLSDLHQAWFGPGQNKLLAAIDCRDYHLVALTGDFISGTYDFAPTAKLLAGLRAPVFYVYGNHDYPHIDNLEKDLASWGVSVLHNSWQTLGDTSLQIAGVTDPNWTKNNPRSSYKTDLEQALAGTDPTAGFTLLLSHSPAIFAAAAAAHIPLVLCGHTHGGQVKIPLLGAPTTASGKFFDTYVQGIYRKKNSVLYINRGLGTSGLPIRFLSPPEVAFLRLVQG